MEIELRARDGSVRARAHIDDEDAALAERRWFLHSMGYACANVTIDGRKTQILLHRAVLGLRPGDRLEIDHRDGDPLNCRRENLRVATRSQNMQNTCSRGGSSRYRGVYWHKQIGKWAASAMLNYKTHYLGCYDDEDEAGRVVAAWRAEHMPFSEERTKEARCGAHA